MKPAARHSRRLACVAILAAATIGRAAEGVVPTPGGAPDVVATRVTLDFPAGIVGLLHVTVRDASGRKTLFEADSDITPDAGRPPLTLPPLRPGRYTFSARRADGSWTCEAGLRFPDPVAARLFVPWRDPVVVEGQIVSTGGEPVVDVSIDSSTEAPRDGLAPPPRGQLEAWRCSGPSAGTKSGDGGSFRILTDPRSVTLIVAGGWTDPRGIAFRSRTGPRSTAMRLMLVKPRRVTATVLDGEDRPLRCKARIVIDDRDERWAAAAAPGGLKDAACDSEGRLEAGPFVAGVFELDISSDDALPARIPGLAGNLGIIRLDRGATLRVTLQDPDRGPVRGAAVTTVSRDGFVLERTARSGVDGVARIKGLPHEARLDVAVEAPGFRRWTRRGINPDGDLVVPLVPAADLRGIVKDPDGSGVRAIVEASTPGGSVVTHVRSDDDGRFSFASLPEGALRLQASAPGYRPSRAVGVTVDDHAADDPVELTLAPVARLGGTVRGPAGDPVSGATVVLTSGGVLLDPPESAALSTARTAVDGTFALEATGAPDETVVAIALGYGAASRRVATFDERSPVDLVLPLEARIDARLPAAIDGDAVLMVADESGATRIVEVRGRREILVDGLAAGAATTMLLGGQRKSVRLPAGETVTVDLSAGARVHGHVTSRGRPSPRTAVVLAAEGENAAGGGTLTAADGSYALFAAAGTWIVIASSGEGRAERRITVPPEGDVEADLQMADRTLRVTVVERGTGAPIAGATVVAGPRLAACREFGESGSVRDGIGWNVAVNRSGCARGLAGDDGIALVALPGSGAHTALVAARGFAPWGGVADVVEGTVDLRAELVPGGPPSVRIAIDSDPPGVSGTLYCVQGGRSSSQAPVAGESFCEGLQPGPAEVAFRAPEFGMARAAIEVPESGETTLTLHVARGGELVAPLDGETRSVRVIDGQGTVWNRPYGLGWPRCGVETVAGAGRAYVCHELPPGTYDVEIDGARRGSATIRGGEAAVVR